MVSIQAVDPRKSYIEQEYISCLEEKKADGMTEEELQEETDEIIKFIEKEEKDDIEEEKEMLENLDK